MSESNWTPPTPNDVVSGDTKAMPNRGTSIGNVPNNSYGADTSQGAINRLGSAHLPPDPAEMCCPPGDTSRFTSGGHSTTNPGGALSGADSDPVDMDRADDPKGL